MSNLNFPVNPSVKNDILEPKSMEVPDTSIISEPTKTKGLDVCIEKDEFDMDDLKLADDEEIGSDYEIEISNPNECELFDPEDETWKNMGDPSVKHQQTFILDPVLCDGAYKTLETNEIPIVAKYHRRSNIKLVYQMKCLEDSHIIKPNFWHRAGNFFIDVPQEVEFWRDLEFYSKLVYMSGQKMIKQYPMDLLNQANIVFDAKCIGTNYRATAKGLPNEFDYFVGNTSMAIDKALRPTPVWKMIDGSLTSEFVSHWAICYTTPVNFMARKDFNPDRMVAERMKFIYSDPGLRHAPLIQHERILSAFNDYVVNMEVMRRRDRMLAPDLVSYEPGTNMDKHRPPQDILNVTWTNDHVVPDPTPEPSDGESSVRRKSPKRRRNKKPNSPNKEASRRPDTPALSPESRRKALEALDTSGTESQTQSSQSQSENTDAEGQQSVKSNESMVSSKSRRRRRNKKNLHNEVDMREYLEQKNKDRENKALRDRERDAKREREAADRSISMEESSRVWAHFRQTAEEKMKNNPKPDAWENTGFDQFFYKDEPNWNKSFRDPERKVEIYMRQ